MSTRVNYTSLVISLIGFAKIVLEQFGISLPDNTADITVNFFALLVTLYGIFKSHITIPKKADNPPVPSK